MLAASSLIINVYSDNTGAKSSIPVIYHDKGLYAPFLKFMLEKDADGMSMSTKKKYAAVVVKLMDYMEANSSFFDDPKELFQQFAKCLFGGTIGEDGLDPSGLGWLPISRRWANQNLGMLTVFSTWLEDNYGVKSINPLRKATSHEERLLYAAWYQRNQRDFLGHIRTYHQAHQSRQVRSVQGRKTRVSNHQKAISFPEIYFNDFFLKGIGGINDFANRIRNQLLLLLLHGAGLRIHEPFNLWVTDVSPHSNYPDMARVRIFDEVDGKAPFDYRSLNGSTTRQAYLMEKHGRIPRRLMTNNEATGDKNRVVDHTDESSIEIYWFPDTYGKAFWKLWNIYINIRQSVDAQHGINHPYAFISFKSSQIGKPYTIGAFRQAYNDGLRRIGLTPNWGLGLSPHGHRHSYGRRATKAGVDPQYIQKMMHHSSIESQRVYTEPEPSEITKLLNDSKSQLLIQDDREFDWEEWLTSISDEARFSRNKASMWNKS